MKCQFFQLKSRFSMANSQFACPSTCPAVTNRVRRVSLPCPRVQKYIKILDTIFGVSDTDFRVSDLYPCPTRVGHGTRSSRAVSVLPRLNSLYPYIYLIYYWFFKPTLKSNSLLNNNVFHILYLIHAFFKALSIIKLCHVYLYFDSLKLYNFWFCLQLTHHYCIHIELVSLVHH